jgi:molybdopterin molybdotransferase
MITVDEALARLFALCAPLPAETIPLAEAAGRVLAEPVTARRDQPPFAASAMDGYALAGPCAAGDLLRVVGRAGAGHGFDGHLNPGEALRIFTGAPVPSGCDRVVIQENTAPGDERVRVDEPPALGANIRPAGQDFRAGDRLSAPRRIKPVDLALIAAMNLPELRVARRPRVAIIATGDELVMPGDVPRADQIVASNGFALKAMAEAEGAQARLLPIARDERARLRAVLELARDADVIVTIGGASVGDADLVAAVAAELGSTLAFHKIAMRPGKPLMAGRLFNGILLGLPGNPVSAIVCAHLFLLPLLRALQGLGSYPAPTRAAVLSEPVAANGPRAHYMRATLEPEGGIRPAPRQDSALLGVLAGADALLIRPAGDVARAAGHPVRYLPL